MISNSASWTCDGISLDHGYSCAIVHPRSFEVGLGIEYFDLAFQQLWYVFREIFYREYNAREAAS